MEIQHPVPAKILCQQTSMCQKTSWTTCRNAGQKSSDNTRSGYWLLILISLISWVRHKLSHTIDWMNLFFNMWHVSLRTGKENDVLILAPANTPLQYPMRGFRVTPLNKTPIPGESDFSQSFISFLLISSINLDSIHSQMHLQKVTVRYALPIKNVWMQSLIFTKAAFICSNVQ